MARTVVANAIDIELTRRHTLGELWHLVTEETPQVFL